MKAFRTSHLIKSEDLNHHGTLYAGRSAEWLVESAFIAAAATHGDPEEILCLNIHGFVFKAPVQKGDLLLMTSVVVRAGRTSLTVHVKAEDEITRESPAEGFITFVTVDRTSHQSKVHNISLDGTLDPEELALREQANKLFDDRNAIMVKTLCNT